MSIMSEKEVIYKTALGSRILIFAIQYISNVVVPDHEPDVFRFPKLNESGILDTLIDHIVGGFVRWDAQHFMHISRYGYTYEQILAFFPLCPYLVRCVALTLSNFVPSVNMDSLTLVVFLCVNTFCFIQSALCLYELSLHFVNKKLAYAASILFCFNPASVFFSAPYTECLFSYLTFRSMLNCVLLYKKYCDIHSHLQVRDVAYILPICLSTVTRSNGVLNIGFLMYVIICLYLEKVKLKKQIFDKLLHTCKFITLAIILGCLCILPFILFQVYGFQMYCTDFISELPPTVLQHKDIEKFVLPGSFSKHQQAWCFNKLPLSYSYIQSYYWKVGFLQYYELRQVPNFVLAFPIVFILLEGAFQFLKKVPRDIVKIFNFNLLQHTFKRKSKLNPAMNVFIIHATALTLFCVTNIHVQVTTRMLCSASPVLYWFCACHVCDLSKETLFKEIIYIRYYKREHLIIVYFLSYFVIGTVLFCNYLPWT
ncbi:GPI mannosyltransferase 2 [Zophobas morio]|uniref:GPI mannosyltransferase 2 n=1 Tax=Zophobas morio TaxID=2755281 RepID=UPI0030836BEA